MPFFYSSSAIRRAEYNAAATVLELWFVESGGPYSYYGVPQSVFDGLCLAASKGTYFNDHIRDRYYVTP